MADQFHLGDLFETVAATVPDRLVVVSDSHSLTYAEMNRRADALASGLAAHGVSQGDRVGLYLHNRAEHLESFIAVCKLGAVPFNVNYRYRGEELRYLFTNAGAAAIIHDAQFSDNMRELRPDLRDLKVSVAVEDGSGADISGSLAYDDLLKAPYSGPWPHSEDDCLLTYTGGTTGMPKGVMWPHRAFFFSCAGAGGYFNPHGPASDPQGIAIRAETGYPLRTFPTAPLMHAAAFWSVWAALLNGLTVVLNESVTFDPEEIWDKAERHHVNIISLVGDAMAIPLRDALRANPGRWNLAGLMSFGSGGAVFSDHVKADVQELLGSHVRISDGMGSSETGISGMAEQSEDGIMRLPCDDNQKVVIGDRFAAVGETGFVARSGNTPIGYHGDPEKTAEVFRMIDGRLWAVSGDSARLDADGKITMFGRGSTCINTGGEKVFPEEVEQALRSHPAIRDAVVAGQRDERWGERVVAIVSPRENVAQPSLDELRDYLRTHLAGYKLPRAVVWVDRVVRSPSGKQDYRWAKSVADEAA